MVELVSTARRRELGAELQRIRERSGLNGIDMATKLGWAPSMVSSAETGKRTMSPTEVAAYMGLCGVAGRQLTDLLSLADEPDIYRLKQHGDQLPDELRTLIFHEQTATAIHSFQPVYIPGVAQTEDYVRSLFTGLGIDPSLIENGVRNRVSRRAVLTRARPAQCSFYVHENVLRTPVGDPQVMYEQMLHLLFLGNRPHCAIRVVPFAAGARGTASGAFQIFDYPEGPPVVCLQHETTSEFLESRTDLLRYRTTLNRVATAALDEARSRELIASLASAYERQGVARNGGRPGGLAKE